MDDRTRSDDRAVAVVATVVLVGEVLVEAGDRGVATVALGVTLAMLQAGSLLYRSRAALPAYVVNGIALGLQAQLVFAGAIAPFANLVGIHAAGRWAPRGRSWLALVALLPGLVGFFTAEDAPVQIPVLVALLWAAAWYAGVQARARVVEQAAHREELARTAVVEERARIARDVHDHVGHAVTVMLVQAGAARRLLPVDPEAAGEAVGRIEEVGRSAMEQLDELLGLLGTDVPAPPATASRSAEPVVASSTLAAGAARRGPSSADGGATTGVAGAGRPGLAQLLERVAASGLAVELTDEVARDLLADPVVGEVAHLVVQEALTNVLRHADATRAEVVLRSVGDDLVVQVSDDGGGRAAAVVAGRGLQGMAERVERVGGRLVVEDGTRGLRLRATLPAQRHRAPA